MRSEIFLLLRLVIPANGLSWKIMGLCPKRFVLKVMGLCPKQLLAMMMNTGTYKPSQLGRKPALSQPSSAAPNSVAPLHIQAVANTL